MCLALGLSVLAAGCGGGAGAGTSGAMGGGAGAGTSGAMGGRASGAMGGGASMGKGQMLGGSARTRVLADARLPRRPAAPVSWIAFEVRLRPGQRVRHRHGFAFVYARRGPQVLRSGSRGTLVQPGRASAVGAGAPHVHRAATGSPSIYWEVLLARPGAAPPPGTEARRVFESRPVRGLPSRPQAVFVEVLLPGRGAMTTVHKHPGPELIYVSSGMFTYQSGATPPRMMMPGDTASLPPATAVQKRDPQGGAARFLSWFLVDPAKPFATGAAFGRR